MNTDRAKTICEDLMKYHELTEYTFEWIHTKSLFGYCNETRRKICLSLELVSLNNENDVIDTILHEIAHAIAGCSNNHNDIWKAIAISLGYDGGRCYGNHIVRPMAKYKVYCSNHCFIPMAKNRRLKGGICKTCGKRVIYVKLSDGN